MHLTAEQRNTILDKTGCYVTEACDKCGKLLGPVRYTRKDEAGVWCSRECRGDAERPAIRQGGRPRKYRTQEHARAAKTELQRNRRNGLNEAKTPSQIIETKALAEAKNASLLSP